MHTSLDAEPLDDDPKWMQTPRVHTPYEQNDTLVKILPCTKLRFLAVKRPPHVLCSVSTFVYNSTANIIVMVSVMATPTQGILFIELKNSKVAR